MNHSQFVKIYQLLLNASLILLGLILSYFLYRELYFLVSDALHENQNDHEILGKVLVFFLYFGFISIIVKYFSENYHFPLRYLLYIGITATIRFIVVNRDYALETFFLSLVILVLMVSYIMLNPRQSRIDAEAEKENS